MGKILDFNRFLLEEEDKEIGKSISAEDIEFIKQNSGLVQKWFHHFLPLYARGNINEMIYRYNKKDINSLYYSIKKPPLFKPEEIADEKSENFKGGGFKIWIVLHNLEKFLNYIGSAGYHVIPYDFFRSSPRGYNCHFDFSFIIDEKLKEGEMEVDFMDERPGVGYPLFTSVMRINPRTKEDLLVFIKKAADKVIEIFAEESKGIGNLRLLSLAQNPTKEIKGEYKAERISKEINSEIKKKIAETYKEIVRRSLDESKYEVSDLDITIGDYLVRTFIEDPSKIIPLNKMNLDVIEEIIDSSVCSEIPRKPKSPEEKDPFKEIRTRYLMKNISDLG
jgi:hypothetical protein